MALDAKHRSSIYGKLVPLLGEEDANVLMSEFPSVEADELVTKQFLRAELAVTREELRGEIGSLRDEMIDRMHRQTVTTVGVIVAAAAMFEALGALV